MNPSSRGCVIAVLLSILFLSTAFAQGTVPKFLFVDNYIDGTISVFRVEPLTGQLTQVPGSPFAGGYAIQGLALTPGNKFLYTAGRSVTAFSVNQQTGSLTQLATYPIAGGSGKIIITPNGKFAYAMSDGIYAFSIDSATGALTPVPGSPFDPNVSFGGAAADPTSQYFYAAQLLPQPSAVRGYAIQENGALFTLTGSPYYDPNGPIDVATEPSGRFVYVVNYGGGFSAGISGFSIAAGQGTLTDLPGSPYATGGEASNTIAASSDGRAVVVDNQVQSTTSSLAIQPDGSLALAGTPQPAGYDPRWVTVDPTNDFVYTSSNNSSVVAAYRLDPVSLALEVVPGALWQTGSNPYALTVLAGPEAPYCPLNGVEPSVTLCAPTTSSPSPMRIVAGTTSASAVKSITLVVDGAKTFSNTASEAMDVFVDIPSGPHTLTLQAQNTAGQKFSLARSITVSGSASASCSNRGVLPTVSICTPLAGSQTGNSIHVVAKSVGVSVISSTAVYLDGNEVYSVSGGAVNTYINAAKGSHRILVQSTDTNGLIWGSTVYVSAQ